MKETTSNMSVILIDKLTNSSAEVGAWLTKGGFVIRQANDIGHAMETLSDFTVRTRPDIILLEVSSLRKDFGNIQSVFQLSPDIDNITVLALSEDMAPPDQDCFFAHDLDQLKTVINKTHATYSCMA